MGGWFRERVGVASEIGRKDRAYQVDWWVVQRLIIQEFNHLLRDRIVE